MSKFNPKFLHYPTRTPIMLGDIQVTPSTTVGQLRSLVEERLATDDACQLRVFWRWYREGTVAKVARPFELTDAEAGEKLSAVGITESNVLLLLEGPLIYEDNTGLGKALAMANAQGRQAQDQQTHLLQSLLIQFAAIQETISKSPPSLAESRQQLKQDLADHQAQQITAISEFTKQLKQESELAEARAMQFHKKIINILQEMPQSIFCQSKSLANLAESLQQQLKQGTAAEVRDVQRHREILQFFSSQFAAWQETISKPFVESQQLLKKDAVAAEVRDMQRHQKILDTLQWQTQTQQSHLSQLLSSQFAAIQETISKPLPAQSQQLKQDLAAADARAMQRHQMLLETLQRQEQATMTILKAQERLTLAIARLDETQMKQGQHLEEIVEEQQLLRQLTQNVAERTPEVFSKSADRPEDMGGSNVTPTVVNATSNESYFDDKDAFQPTTQHNVLSDQSGAFELQENQALKKALAEAESLVHLSQQEITDLRALVEEQRQQLSVVTKDLSRTAYDRDLLSEQLTTATHTIARQREGLQSGEPPLNKANGAEARSDMSMRTVMVPSAYALQLASTTTANKAHAKFFGALMSGGDKKILKNERMRIRAVCGNNPNTLVEMDMSHRLIVLNRMFLEIRAADPLPSHITPPVVNATSNVSYFDDKDTFQSATQHNVLSDQSGAYELQENQTLQEKHDSPDEVTDAEADTNGKEAPIERSPLAQSHLQNVEDIPSLATSSDHPTELTESTESSSSSAEEEEEKEQELQVRQDTSAEQKENNCEQSALQSTCEALLKEEQTAILRNLWEALVNDHITDEEEALALPMRIILDPQCGMEIRTTGAEGEMKGGMVLNDERGGLTPLIMAANAGRVDVMKALLKIGVVVDAAEETYGFAAIDIAAATNNPPAIELLINYGADLNGGRSFWTPLHLAVLFGRFEAIEVLVAKGADITVVNRDGDTPLMLFEKDKEKSTINKLSQEKKDRIRKLLTPE